jgi:acetylornithine/succinyldiaminopimelate/putrescine aminotransferase/predicted amino acid dehydrogenase
MNNDYTEYCRPALGRLLAAASLDAEYTRAEGDRLWWKRGEQLIEVLDLVGGYGANLFGHHHPVLAAEQRRLLDACIPIQAQGSIRSAAGRLASALCKLLGDYVVIFTNSGTETIEAALKHAHLERPRRMLWAVKGAFHGKTLGSVRLTHGYHQRFATGEPEVRFLDPENPSEWEQAERDIDHVTAAFVEPLLGEGGVRPLPADFVRWLTRTCRAADVPLVVDEIQSGMGRTGQFLASQAMGIRPDYLCLSKALGGGLAKIGALMIRRGRFVEEFSIIHTSTFAEDDLSCSIALKALEVLQVDDIPNRCGKLGDYLLAKLEEVRQRFPSQIKEIRGRGLMIGIELRDLSDSPCNTFRMFSEQQYFGALAASYFLNAHRIRVATTLSQPFTLRVEPSAYISETDLDRFVDALETFCRAVDAMDVPHLMGAQVGRPAAPIADYRVRPKPRREEPNTSRRVGFIGHLILPEHAVLWDPSLRGFEAGQLEAYLGRTSPITRPTIIDRVNVRSRTGDEVHLSMIGLNLTSRQMADAIRQHDSGSIMRKIEAAVTLAREEGCHVVGLGGYTSIVSVNGLRVKTAGVALTSGNALTVAMGLEALRAAAKEKGIDVPRSRIGIVGASGNIGSMYASLIAPEVGEMVLVTRPAARARASTIADEIRRAVRGLAVEVATSIEALRDCPLVVAASSDPETLIYPGHLGPGPVVICDISLPPDVASSVRQQRGDVLVVRGGVVRLPENSDLCLSGVPLPRGQVYACIAETLLMGLEGMSSHGSYGRLDPEAVQTSIAMAEKHGFTLGGFKTEDT